MPTKDTPSVVSLQDDLHAAICRVEALERAMTSVYEAGVSDRERFGFYQFFQDTIDRLEAVGIDLEEVKEAVDVAQKFAEILREQDKHSEPGSRPLAEIVKMCDVEKVINLSS